MSSIYANDIKTSEILVCYGKLNPSTIKGYKYVIIEPMYYLPSDIRVLKSQNEKVFAYISLGEVNANSPEYNRLKGSTLGKNEIWDSYYIDLTSENTINVLTDIVNKNLEKGYDGFFYDNVDNFGPYGPQISQKSEMISFIKSINEKYPDKEFIQNAGLELLDETSKYINALLIESVASDYSFTEKKASLRKYKDYKAYLEKIDSISETYKIPIILVEYADTQLIYDQIKNRINHLDYYYFIGTIDLQTVPKFKK